jgi:hypothetical protein
MGFAIMNAIFSQLISIREVGSVGCLWIVGIDFFLSPVLTNSGSGLNCEVGFGYIGCLLGFKMDPTWREIKCILCRHEEIVESNNMALQQVSVKMGELEQTVSNLTLHIDDLETKCQFLRSLVFHNKLSQHPSTKCQ